MTRQADYGIVLLTCFAHEPADVTLNAGDLARAAHLPVPMVGKILKLLARAGLLESTRGARGGYRLARSPDDISVAEIIEALEGPIAITECTGADAASCDIVAMCAVRTNWQKINQVVRHAIEGITLSQMAGPIHLSRSGEIAPAPTH